nr:MAG TPA: hypothetical protein [Caudoviricetes sp.]DAX14455.1 MAG TPA: hypothetical protein [Bacteriophage sp.]
MNFYSALFYPLFLKWFFIKTAIFLLKTNDFFLKTHF